MVSGSGRSIVSGVGAALGTDIDRSDSFQCRISNGEQVQVDVGDGSSKLAQKWVAGPRSCAVG